MPLLDRLYGDEPNVGAGSQYMPYAGGRGFGPGGFLPYPQQQPISPPQAQGRGVPNTTAAISQQLQPALPAAQGGGGNFDFLGDFLKNMQGTFAGDRARGARQSQAAQTAAFEQNQRLGGYYDTATSQMFQNFRSASDTLKGMMKSPYLQGLMNIAYNRVQRPGLPESVIAGVKGGAAARSAANQSSAQRNLMWGSLGKGMGPRSRNFMSNLMSGKAGDDLSRQLSGIDLEAAEFAKQDEGAALGQAGQLLSMRQNLGRDYARTLTGYNPLQWLGQIQGMQAPVAQLGYNIGAL